MDNLDQRIGEVLLDLEAELRRLGLWEGASPPPRDLQSSQPFCYDTLSFPQWLQWLFLVRMRALVELGGPYPARSAIHPYAEEWAEHAVVEPAQLLLLIKRFDDLITARPSMQQD